MPSSKNQASFTKNIFMKSLLGTIVVGTLIGATVYAAADGFLVSSLAFAFSAAMALILFSSP